MKPADELLASFDRSWKEFSAAWKKAHHKSSEKSVHDLRVNTRRLIAILELTRALSNDAEIPKLERRFKKVLKTMGPLRDVQVQLIGVSQIRRKNELLPKFRQALERQERRKIENIGSKLKGGKKHRLTKGIKSVRSKFERTHEKSTEKKIHQGIKRLLKTRRTEFLKTRKQFQPSNEETLHQMRIALKKLRYAVEAAQPVLHNSAKTHAREMHTLQQLLGDTRDAELLRNRLEIWATRKGKKIAIAPVLDALQEKREALMQKIVKSAAALDAVFSKPAVPAVVEKTKAVELAEPSAAGRLAMAHVVSLD